MIFRVFHFFIFFEEKVSSFLFSCISFKYFKLLALVSEFNCFLRSRCSMEMWCPDDVGPDCIIVVVVAVVVVVVVVSECEFKRVYVNIANYAKQPQLECPSALAMN